MSPDATWDDGNLSAFSNIRSFGTQFSGADYSRSVLANFAGMSGGTWQNTTVGVSGQHRIFSVQGAILDSETEPTTVPSEWTLTYGTKNTVVEGRLTFTLTLTINYDPPPGSMPIKYGTGGAWVDCTPHYGTGSSWQSVIVHYGTGGSWSNTT